MTTYRGISDYELGVACGRLFDRLETALSLMLMPPDVQCGIVRKFEGSTSALNGLDGAHLSIAVLKLDSAAAPMAAGQRRQGAGAAARRLVFSTESADVALRMRRCGYRGGVDLKGQVYRNGGSDGCHYSAVLLRGMKEEAAAESDDLGEFEFKCIAPGRYHMLLSHGSSDLMVVPLHVWA